MAPVAEGVDDHEQPAADVADDLAPHLAVFLAGDVEVDRFWSRNTAFAKGKAMPWPMTLRAALASSHS